MKTTINEIFKEPEKFLNKEIEIEGWIRTSRSSKKFGFIEINDGTFFSNLQIVFSNELQNFKEVEKLPISSAINVKGILVQTPEAKQPFEVQAREVIIVGYSDNDYPLQKKGILLSTLEL